MADTNADPPARLLDLTRLARRVGKPLTGIDRVERAYLSRLLLDPVPLFGLVRTPLGYILTGEEGCADFLRRMDTGDWGTTDRLSRMRYGAEPVRARAESALRRHAVARAVPQRLTSMLIKALPKGVHYLNTGHSNLTDRVVGAIRAVPGARVAVLLHDTIPLDLPQYQADGMSDRFRTFLDHIYRDADLVICNSHQTRSDLKRHLPDGATLPNTVVAHLGVDVPEPGTAPTGPWTGQPYFVALGTIEPRKNHSMLLDLWEQEAPDAQLLICGSRGWRNEDIFSRLDAGIPGVHELSGVADAGAFALLAESAGLLFPSHAEGFGLPPLEAASLGVPVVCNDLPSLRETLVDIPVYAEVSDRYLWSSTIRRLSNDHRAIRNKQEQPRRALSPPTWAAHFKTVLTLI